MIEGISFHRLLLLCSSLLTHRGHQGQVVRQIDGLLQRVMGEPLAPVAIGERDLCQRHIVQPHLLFLAKYGFSLTRGHNHAPRVVISVTRIQ